MWKLYDDLISKIDESIIVSDYMIGTGWSYIEADGNLGVALTVKEKGRDRTYKGPIIGMPLKEIALLSKSWNFLEASLGVAAINCYYNSVKKIELIGGFKDSNTNDTSLDERKKKDAFIHLTDKIKGKNVAIIGHFPNIEKQFAPYCNLSILERIPSNGDYPDCSCEYILPNQDYVFITGMTFINKTLPRLLEICKKGPKVSIVGPSIPITDILYSYGVNNISGYCCCEFEEVKDKIRFGYKREIFQSGRMVSIENDL